MVRVDILLPHPHSKWRQVIPFHYLKKCISVSGAWVLHAELVPTISCLLQMISLIESVMVL